MNLPFLRNLFQSSNQTHFNDSFSTHVPEAHPCPPKSDPPRAATISTGSLTPIKSTPILNNGSPTILGKRTYEQHNGLDGKPSGCVCARCCFYAAHTTHTLPTLLAMSHSLVLNSPTRIFTNPHTGKHTHTHTRYFNLWMAFRVVMVTDQQWLTWIISPAGDQTPKTQTKGTVTVDSKGGLPEHVAWMLGTLMYALLSHCASLPSCLYEGFGEKPMFSGYINSWWAWHHSVQSSKAFFFTPILIFQIAFPFGVLMHLLLLLVLWGCDKWHMLISNLVLCGVNHMYYVKDGVSRRVHVVPLWTSRVM